MRARPKKILTDAEIEEATRAAMMKTSTEVISFPQPGEEGGSSGASSFPDPLNEEESSSAAEPSKETSKVCTKAGKFLGTRRGKRITSNLGSNCRAGRSRTGF